MVSSLSKLYFIPMHQIIIFVIKKFINAANNFRVAVDISNNYIALESTIILF